MSNLIVYDSILVRYLARELDERLRARRLRGVRMDPGHRRLTLELDDHRLVWELHPTRGWIRLLTGALPAEAEEGWGGRRIRTQRRPRVRRVVAPPDERWLALDIDAGGADRASRFVVELMTNQWNALAVAPDGTILAALWPRQAGGRDLRPGRPYAPPGGDGPGREGADAPVTLERWESLLEPVPPGDRARALVRSLAWTSPTNAASILEGAPRRGPGDAGDAGDAGEEGAGGPSLRSAWERYTALATLPDPRPQLLALRGGQPYPLPLPGVAGRPTLSLLAAFEGALESEAPALAPEVRSALESRLEKVARRAERLREEAAAAPGRAGELRRRADLLMAQLHGVRKGQAEAELDDFQGGTLVVELDPALSPAENAKSLYDRARKRERAAERLPARVREAVAERNRLESLLAQLESGEADPAEVERWLAAVRPETGDEEGEAARRPYLRFRSSGGLEIRVGRSGRANDDLTFHHSSPDDIWLHARDVGGAHVILRWSDTSQNPPKRDLMEAAILAALNSKARSSATVPVDWTRRKYVRKPRKAPPGAVLPDRVATVFVEPDPALPERLVVD